MKTEIVRHLTDNDMPKLVFAMQHNHDRLSISIDLGDEAVLTIYGSPKHMSALIEAIRAGLQDIDSSTTLVS